MLDTKLKQNGPPDTFDNTILSNYCECPRQCYWFFRGIDYVNVPPYFIFGRALGAGLNAYYETEGPTQLRTLKMILEAENLWNEEAPEPGRNDNIENLRRILKDYAQAYPEENWHQESHHGELGFAFPIPGTEIYYAGSVDAYIEWPGYGVLIREDKSTGGYLGTNYQSHWARASQVTGYLWAIAQMIGEAPFGALINMISKRKSKNPEDQFARNIVTKSEWQLNEFMHQTVGIADRIRREWDDWQWRKEGERVYIKCVGGAGRSPCLYNSLCLKEIDPWELDEQGYDYEEEYALRSEKWAPWERKGDT
jgi:hypothetical protein